MVFLRKRIGFSIFAMLSFVIFLTACGGGGGGSSSSSSNLPIASFIAQTNGSIPKQVVGNVSLEADNGTLAEGATVVVYEREYGEGAPKYNFSVASKVYSFAVKNKNNLDILSSIKPLELTIKNNMLDADKIFVGSRKANSADPWSYTLASSGSLGNIRNFLFPRLAVENSIDIDVFKFDMEYVLFGVKKENFGAIKTYAFSLNDYLNPEGLYVDSTTKAYKENVKLRLRVYGSNISNVIKKGGNNYVVRLNYQNDNTSHIANLIIGADVEYSSSTAFAGSGNAYTHIAEIKNISEIENPGTDEASIYFSLALKDKKISDFPRNFCVELVIDGNEDSLPCSLWEDVSIDEPIAVKLEAPANTNFAPSKEAIKISFNKGLDIEAGEVHNFIKLVKKDGNKPVPNCKYTFDNSKKLLTIAHDELAKSTDYSVIISSGIAGVEDETVLLPETLSFKTEPEVVYFGASLKQNTIIGYANIEINFEKSVSATQEDFKNYISIKKKSDSSFVKINGFALDSTKKKLTVTHDDMLHGSAYNVVIKAGIKGTETYSQLKEAELPITVNEPSVAGGKGTEAEPYQIATLFQLQSIVSNLDKHFIQIRDIDLEGYVGWEPIGNDILAFSGGYSGNGKKIKNLKISKSAQDNVGLFGKTHNGVLSGIILENVDISGLEFVGGLVGRQEGGTIATCSVSGIVRGGGQVGGLVGINDNGSIDKCSSIARLDAGLANFVGGLVAYNDRGSIWESWVKSVEITGGNNVGGLVGVNNSGSILHSYAQCNSIIAKASDPAIANFVAENRGPIVCSYAKGDFKFIHFQVAGNITDCFNVGSKPSGELQIAEYETIPVPAPHPTTSYELPSGYDKGKAWTCSDWATFSAGPYMYWIVPAGNFSEINPCLPTLTANP